MGGWHTGNGARFCLQLATSGGPKNIVAICMVCRAGGINNAQAIIDGKATPDQLGVTAVDAHTLKIQLDKPLPWFVNLTANFAFFPVQKANVESGKEWTKPGNLIGNGAYVLKERVVNEKLVVVPNTHYWDNAKTVLQKVTFLPINQESAATKRYLAGILISPNPSRKICIRSC